MSRPDPDGRDRSDRAAHAATDTTRARPAGTDEPGPPRRTGTNPQVSRERSSLTHEGPGGG